MNEKIKEESIDRLEILLRQGVKEEVVYRYRHENKVCYSVKDETGHIVHRDFDDDPELKKILQSIEQEYDVHVYYGMVNDLGFAKVLTLLAVNKYENEWAEEKRSMLVHRRALAYAYDIKNPWSEAGEMQYKIVEGGIVRTA